MSLFVLILSLLFGSFFSGLEMTYVSCNKERFEFGISAKTFSAKIIAIFLNNPRVFGATLMIGYYLSMAIAVISLYYLFTGNEVYNLSTIALLCISILILFILFVIVELTAHTFFSINPYGMLSAFYIPLLVVYIAFYPLAQTLAAFGAIPNFLNPSNDEKNRFLNVFIRKSGNQRVLNAQHEMGTNHKQISELTIFQNALVFSKVRIRDCMVPRTEVESIDISKDIVELREKFVTSGYSKIIVYRDSIDNVEGFVHTKEMFRKPATIQERLTAITFVPETMPANKLLHEFMQHHRSISVVVDEYGGTAGIVTLEDIMEKIFGDIEDEHDTDDLIEKRIKPNEYVLSSRLEIEYLNSEFGFKIPESEEYGTLAGFILYHYHNLPKPNEIIKIGRFAFKILKVTNTRIDLVYLKVEDE